ncbi:MAG: tetratricopeptide repeat protein [Steroidobacteraceae bacterium]
MPEGRDGEQAPDAALAAPGVVHSRSGTHKVFISYASSDRAVADSVCAALEQVGMMCWIAPRDVTPGELYSEAIVHAIDSTTVVVLVLSQNAAVSQHVLREVERASSKRHPVVSFRIDLAPIPAALEYFLNTSQWLDASATGVERALPKLVDAVQRGVAHASDPTTAHSVGTPPPPPRTDPGASVATQTRQRSRVMLAVLAAITAIAFAYLVVDQFWVPKRVDQQKALVEATSTSPTNPPMTAAIPDKSIAILPFADMSEKKDQEYMSDGIAEELLNLLAQVPDLRVIARTSSFAFKGEKIEIAEIAKKLNVAHVVEGSIRKSGNKLRITAQLVRAADSTHLWSETYDRPLDDIFAVQDEIAGAIVQALQIRLAGGELNRRKGGTQNLEAYQLFLRSLSALNENSKASLDAAGEYAEQAIKIDPSFGNAWMLLGWIVATKTDNGWLDAAEGYERARGLAQHALQVSPDIAEAHALLQYVYQTLDWDWSAAKAEGQRALAIDPTNSVALQMAGILSYTLGRWDDAERQLRAALVRDPLSPYAHFNLGVTYYLAGRFAEAEDMFRKLLELEPSFGWTRRWLAKTLLAQGKPEAALAMVQQETDGASRLAILPVVLQALGRKAEADEALKSLISHWADTWPFYVAQTYAYRGDHDRALEWLERAYKQKDSGLTVLVGEPLFKGMADDPRYKAFLRKMKLPEQRPQEAPSL